MEKSMCKQLSLALFLFIVPSWLHSPALGRSVEAGDALISREVMPAVVLISTWKLLPVAKAGEPRRRAMFYGSGFIIDPSGIIVTNKHVIDGAAGLTVIFSNGDRSRASVLKAGAMLDLAVLKVDVGHPLASLKWANSDALQVGDPVLAIGNALDFGTSVSAGIVSGLNRNLFDSPFDSYIQTDAAINHGNSGGPLVDRNGDVVGIDTALDNPNPNGGFIGIGFAIPSNTANFAVHFLLDPSQPKPGWLGFNLQDMTEALAQAFRLPPETRGAIISAVTSSGPASSASLRPGDVLTKLDGIKLTDSRAFMWAIAKTPVGKLTHLTVWRDRKEQDVTATIAEWPNYMPGGGVVSEKMAQVMMDKEPDPGVKLGAINNEARRQYGLDPTLTVGALVTSVEPDSEAHDLGIVPGDVITATQAEPVGTPNDVQRAISAARAQHLPYLAVLVRSKNSVRWLSLSIGGANS
jgi:serine protease Do